MFVASSIYFHAVVSCHSVAEA